MKKCTILYLPLDERPCNAEFVCKIAHGTPAEVVCPGAEILGDKKQPADFGKVRKFLVDNVAKADACVISVDMLLYGGIVPSRLHEMTEAQLTERLQVLAELKKINTYVKIYAFSLIMRCPCYSSDDEEPAYYERCGREIFLSGQVKHKLREGLLTEAQAQALLARYKTVTGSDIDDFEKRRATNLAMLLKLLADNPCDYFVVPQDDSAEYGYTTMDRLAVKKFVADNGLPDVPMYPGADEVGMTLTSRAVTDFYGKHPQVYCHWTNERAQNVTPLYEDRPVGKTVPVQLAVAGCAETAAESACDIDLFLNYPTEKQVEASELPVDGYKERNLDKFCTDALSALRQNKVVAIADGGYCNGGDVELLQMLSEHVDLTDIPAYAGWNTSSNTLGTAICEAVFVWLFGQTEQSKLFVAERYAEDAGYCGCVRGYMCDNVLPEWGLDYFHADGSSGKVAARVAQELNAFLADKLPQVAAKYKVSHCSMPWRRMFEVRLDMDKI